MGDVYIVEACRSPIGKRGKGLAGLMPADLLGAVQKAALDRSGIAPEKIDQVIGGCVSQVGEQSFNIARIAWLSQGLPLEIPATTVDSQCGSSQQATSLGASMVAAGIEDIVMSCGVEMMSRVPLGSNMKDGVPMGESYMSHYQPTSQFQGAAMVAEEYQITREHTDAFGLASQEKAIQAWEENRFDREVVPIEAPVLGDDFKPTGKTRTVTKDEGLRATTLESLQGLDPVPGQELHTAGTSSQVSDGAAAVIMASESAVKDLGLQPRAKIVATTLVGVDPVTMLKGPIPATRKVLDKAGLTVDDIDIFEVNEAFASVVLAWEKDLGIDPAKTNVNGGAIALGHPTGSTGARLITTALHELERAGGKYALIAMCCGGGLGTGTIIERLD
ncbi:MAG TPA: steroid 3-ketoacyl-CoA thiolase [Arenicellales bacterium]|jgi:acetyl-CoA C-acetyltransferase|nr:steroid 3-ketoacyl-CoA thiolase [Pseudomonadales bacterium]MDP7314661.1 steroid 3-ketoacyl-CoA thiolase [Pseudomonadales bacterium]MDP7577572.1 steroid 3-ketoacyl-CoA thiolase [Pseudomonadales bacterium]HJL52149.1 steroid 3-ketoacyl-CoA thiolase [Arenicellales bacterium]HJP50437.1 steroid 3-ketoacyl-CoA thiolase [Pseudomonadales bacterium]|tara:strand:+ start:30774 stop:31940 length:1167 start_codon:yes stop_codon:yes gene_type:complete